MKVLWLNARKEKYVLNKYLFFYKNASFKHDRKTIQRVVHASNVFCLSYFANILNNAEIRILSCAN